MKLTEAEWQIMKALWEGFPATTRQVSQRLPAQTNWAYTTIKTMLTRLTEKGAVEEVKHGNVGHYEPLLSRKKAQRSALGNLVDNAFDGAFGPLMHFLVEEQNLSPRQRSELINALEGRTKKVRRK